MLRELHEQHPEILIELDDSQDIRDLGEGEADIALRSAYGDLGSGVVGRRLGDRRLDALLQPRLCRRARRPDEPRTS